MLTLNQFASSYAGKAVDFDGAYGCQCVDLVQYYNRDVVGSGVRFSGNAIDLINQNPSSLYTVVRNSPSNFPAPGAIVVFGAPYGYLGGRYYGHTGVVLSANVNSLTVLEQNDPYGTATHVKSYNYNGVLGWLQPKSNVNPGTAPAPAAGVVPVIRNVTTRSIVNVRTAPTTTAPLAKNASIPNGQLSAGVTISITGYEHAQNVSGNDVWLRTVNGNWIWSGATNW